MSIVIKGMDMPEGNSTKNLLIYSDGRVFTGHKDDVNYFAEELSEGIKYVELSEEDYEKMAEQMRKSPPMLISAQPEVDCQKCVFCGFAGFKQFQTAQPEVIRCKDCKWHEGRYHCLNFDVFGFDYNDYCSLAARKEQDDS